MKKLYALLTLVMLCAVSYAKPVSQSTAKTIAYNFLSQRTGSLQSVNDLQLSYTSASGTTDAEHYFYVFSAQNSFVIVAADDDVSPVLGYSKEVSFVSANMDASVAAWLEVYTNQIKFVKANAVAATPAINDSWNELQSGTKKSLAKTTVVSPLLTTTWDQAPNYNQLCPYDNTANDRTVTGCVATAMAQIVKFWNFPAVGTGFHSYNDPTYGPLSANFGTTAYDWVNMPDHISNGSPAVQKTAIATLMLHLGISVDMTYGVAAVGGSGAYVISSQSPVTNCSEYALKTYFSYKTTMQGLARQDYDDATWIGMLKADLDGGHPYLYTGFGSEGGHCFVGDGYDASDFMHINWGWGGQDNGYFEIDALNPASLGIGGGSGGFNDGQQALIGIEPGTLPANDSLELTSNVAPSLATINYGQAFSVTTSILNYADTTNFHGNYSIAIFDVNNLLVGYVDSLTNMSLAPGAGSGNITFNTAGNQAMLPGVYSLQVYYDHNDGNWIKVSDNSPYTNAGTITVISANTIEVYGHPIQLNPGTTLTTGQPVTVTLNAANTATTAFDGTLDVSLYNLDGTFAGQIMAMPGMHLDAGTSFSADIVFHIDTLTVIAGNYLLALKFSTPGQPNLQLAGSTFYTNPIHVTVAPGPLSPDIYEVNNTKLQAYNLPVVFTNDVDSIVTTGSNIHIGTDQDYYKIYLPFGYEYTVSARLNDRYNTIDGNAYSLDAIFQYSTDGTSWSSTYDAVLPAPIPVGGNTTIYFHVSPNFQGSTGTYVLDIQNITRTVSTSIPNVNLNDLVNIYPNPATNVVNVDLNGVNATGISVFDMQGRVVLTQATNNQTSIKLAVNGLADGLYYVAVKTDKGIVTKKITVTK